MPALGGPSLNTARAMLFPSLKVLLMRLMRMRNHQAPVESLNILPPALLLRPLQFLTLWFPLWRLEMFPALLERA